MCGLAGIVDFSVRPRLDEARLMAALLQHRGPDDAGDYGDSHVALAHRRLSIIDLSSAGRQPMTDVSGRYRLVYNGEIYNYRELRSELEAKGHEFWTQTDGEVLLHSYLEWGPRCVRRFNGMWAFALWDSASRELFCSRDRFGVKPLYFRTTGKRLVFASEPKAFRADGDGLAPNEPLIHAYLEHGLVDHTDETLFGGVKQLAPAHSMIFDRGGLRLERYWQLEASDEPARESSDAVRELFLDSIRLRLRSDVPIGTCLSGGLDSSAIAVSVGHLLQHEGETAKPIGERQQTFTSYFKGFGLDERPYAHAVVRRTGAQPHWITFSGESVVESLPAIVEAHDEPFRTTSIIAQWYVMKTASEAGQKVMLDGQGGDEVFAGYDGYFGYLFANHLLAGNFRGLLGELSAYRTVRGASCTATALASVRPFVPERVTRRVRAKLGGSFDLIHPDLHSNGSALRSAQSPFRDPLRRQLYAVLTRRLPELLRYEDRNSMAHSIEAREPFLDYRLVELAFSLEASQLIRRGQTKVVLRRALGDLLPPIVRDRCDKLGFGTPQGRWLRGPLGELAADVFHSRAFRERGFVDAPAAVRRLKAYRRGAHRDPRGEAYEGDELWRALNLELWARAFLDSRSLPELPRLRSAFTTN